jgi:hypothetical protein
MVTVSIVEKPGIVNCTNTAGLVSFTDITRTKNRSTLEELVRVIEISRAWYGRG